MSHTPQQITPEYIVDISQFLQALAQGKAMAYTCVCVCVGLLVCLWVSMCVHVYACFVFCVCVCFKVILRTSCQCLQFIINPPPDPNSINPSPPNKTAKLYSRSK